MKEQVPKLDDVLQVTTLASRSPAEAIDFVGTVVDHAWTNRRADVLRHLTALADTIDRPTASDTDKVLLDYFLGNAWNGLKCLKGPHRSGSWEWEQIEVENEILCLRRAVRSTAFPKVGSVRRCQILTNLGNCHNTTGRFLEAIDAWNEALELEPKFGMARGNRGVGRWSYARALYDKGHAIAMAREAWRDLEPSDLLGLEPGAGHYFASTRSEIEAALPLDALTQTINFDNFPLGSTDAEIAYRRWCLTNRLFLNPLNDIGPCAIAARDILTSPSIVSPISEGPRFQGFFNQIKQEFCSARWFGYEAIHAREPHFADTDVVLYNTLDYPSYSMATEKLKLAFRSSYSLLDKIAYFLNAYLSLGIPEKRVSFRGVWYDAQEKKKGVRQEFRSRANWPLRGLFWLGKDLYEESLPFRSVIDPDAQRLSEIRNCLEHKYLKVHLDLWPGTAIAGSGLADDLAESIRQADFQATTVRLLRFVRAAITYLSLSVHQEERVRAANRPNDAKIVPVELDIWEDGWKR
jgi:tetratricopeptide (TPR) repeat protein